MAKNKPYVIVLGNEKGGTGKSTVAMHVIVSLLRRGYSVGTIDIDARQGTLTRYIENRRLRQESKGDDLPLPTHYALHRVDKEHRGEAHEIEEKNFLTIMEDFQHKDFVVIDTPGSDRFLSRLAHSFADTLITPLNDSPIDLDMLVRVSGETGDILKPSTYSEMVWEQKKQRAKRDGGSIDWIVVRNRLGSLRSRNKEEMARLLKALSKRIGFRMGAGFSERVVFRELFLMGYTLLDMKPNNMSMALSHVSAKQELGSLIDMLSLQPELEEAS